MLRVVVDELVNQIVTSFTHRHEKAQTQIIRCHLSKKIGVQRGIVRPQWPNQNFSPSRKTMWRSSIVACLPLMREYADTDAPSVTSIPAPSSTRASRG